MGQRYPSIEIVRKKDFYTKNLKSQMFVNFTGQRIGEISLSRSAQFTACYYPSPDSAADYVRLIRPKRNTCRRVIIQNSIPRPASWRDR